MSRYSGWETMDDDELELLLINSRAAVLSATEMGVTSMTDEFRADIDAVEQELLRRGRDPQTVEDRPGAGKSSTPRTAIRLRRLPSSALVTTPEDLENLPAGVVVVDLSQTPPTAWQHGVDNTWRSAGGDSTAPLRSTDLWQADQAARWAVVYFPGDAAGLT